MYAQFQSKMQYASEQFNDCIKSTVETYESYKNDYITTFGNSNGLKLSLEKANTHAKVGAVAAVLFTYISFQLCSYGTLGTLVALPFIASIIPTAYFSYNVWRVSSNASVPHALEGTRTEVEARLQNRTKHFGWFVDMLLNEENKKKRIMETLIPTAAGIIAIPEIKQTPVLSSSEIHKNQLKEMLDSTRRTAALVELAAGSIFLCSYALSYTWFSLISTVGYVVAPVLFAGAYGIYYVADKSHSNIENEERKYPEGSFPSAVDLAKEVVSKETITSIFNDCMKFFKPEQVVTPPVV